MGGTPLSMSRSGTSGSNHGGGGGSSGGGSGKKRENESIQVNDEHFTCPVCLDVMVGKISLCPSGHALCMDSCLAQLPQPRRCPTCRIKMPVAPTRGLVIEQMIASGSWTCRLGCGYRCTGASLKEHYAQCLYRKVTCPEGCGEQMNLRDLPKHVFDKHKHHCYPKKNKMWEFADDQYLETSANDEHCDVYDLIVALKGGDDVIYIRIYFSTDKATMYFEASHAIHERSCKITLGLEYPGASTTFMCKTTAFRDESERNVDGAPNSDMLLSTSWCDRLSADGHYIPIRVQVFQ